MRGTYRTKALKVSLSNRPQVCRNWATPPPQRPATVFDGRRHIVITLQLRGENNMMNMPQKHWWHELNTWEPEAALAFYGRTLGWEFEPSPLPDGAAYWIARKDGNPVGGIFELTAPDYDGIPSHWMTYLSVKDMQKAEASTSDAGGEVMRSPVRIPGVGKLAVVTDSTGALIGLIEPDQPAQFPLKH